MLEIEASRGEGEGVDNLFDSVFLLHARVAVMSVVKGDELGKNSA